MKDCEHYRPLIAGLLDGELDGALTEEVNRHMVQCSACREEYDSQREASQLLAGASFQEPTDEVLTKLWRSPYSRAAQLGGAFLVLGGYLVLIAFGIREFMRDGTVDLWPKLAIAAIVLGILTLLALTIRERLHTAKTDPYNEVQR
jgi:anti-sigma factor RsiW